jgi:hypothetical protein
MKSHESWGQAVVVVLALLMVVEVSAQQLNGFDLSGARVPVHEILRGGPPRDGIPSIDDPRFVEASQAQCLHDKDGVMGVVRNGIGKAYPIRILNWHEIVNDRFGDDYLAITFCPLCGSGMVFLRQLAGRPLTFGVSGLLYNSDVLLYDRETESARIESRDGTLLPGVTLYWFAWAAFNPDTAIFRHDAQATDTR